MKLSEIWSMVGPVPVLAHRPPAATVDDLHRRARRRLPLPIADYLDGGAEGEVSLRTNTEAFARWAFTPRSVPGVGSVDTSTTVLGTRWSAPIGLSPTGYGRLMHPDGELGVARAATLRGVPYVLSTVATTTIEDVATVCDPRPPWLQLYALRDRAVTEHMVARAHDAGCEVLELAIDTAVSGNRLRDRRNGLSIPPRLDLPTLARIGIHPAYWWAMVTNPALDFAQVRASEHVGTSLDGGSVADITGQFEAGLSWDDVDHLRRIWPGRLLLKGPVGAVDAVRARDAGVDGVHLSNHGGRQLDRSVPPLVLVPEVRAAAGEDFTILVDSGVRTGADVAIAIALGADAAFVGRPYLWGLASDGAAGVLRVIDILTEELTRTLHLLGVPDVASLRAGGPDLVRAVP